MKVTRGKASADGGEICLPEGVEALASYQIGDEIELSYGIRMYEGDRMTATASYADGESFRTLAKKTFTITGFCEGYGIRRYFMNAVAGFSADALPAQAQLNLTARTEKIQTDTYGQIYSLAQRYGIEQETLQFHNTLLNYSGVMSDLDLFATLLIPTAIIGLIIMVGSIMLIYNAFAISVSERSKQLGMLASVGATRRQKRGSVLFEGLVIGIRCNTAWHCLRHCGNRYYLLGDLSMDYERVFRQRPLPRRGCAGRNSGCGAVLSIYYFHFRMAAGKACL